MCFIKMNLSTPGPVARIGPGKLKKTMSHRPQQVIGRRGAGGHERNPIYGRRPRQHPQEREATDGGGEVIVWLFLIVVALAVAAKLIN